MVTTSIKKEIYGRTSSGPGHPYTPGIENRPMVERVFAAGCKDQVRQPYGKWLAWSQRLSAIARNGLAYADDPYDIERYDSLRELAAEIVADHTDVDAKQVSDLLISNAGHSTPKIDVRAVVFDADSILLVREREDGLWTIPGGWADPLESASEATVRELAEESGYHARALKLLAVYDRSRHDHPPYLFPVYMMFSNAS